MAKIDKGTGKLIYVNITEPVVVQANYLASMQDEHYVDDVINAWTGIMPCNYGTPPCSHTEIGFWVDGELWFFSSTSRKELGSTSLKKNGTRWIRAEELLRNPDRWMLQVKTHQRDCTYSKVSYTDYYEIVVPSIEVKIGTANDMIGLTYDFYGVFADFTNPARVLFTDDLTAEKLAKMKKIYCSKAVHAVDRGELRVMSPKQRYKVAQKLGYNDIDTLRYLRFKGII